ncbi:MAG: hypothetical protein U0790_29000 [Isosphaeraceae bacterium]
MRSLTMPFLLAALVAFGFAGCGSQNAKDFLGGLQESAKVAAEGKAKLKVDRTRGPKGKGMADDDTF